MDGEAWNLFGVSTSTDSANSASLLDASYTSTHSVFTLSAGNATFTLDFFSPVSFDNYVRQSLPFSYLSVTASAGSYLSSDIEIFSAIDESWTGQPEAAECAYSVSQSASIHQLSANGATYSESPDEMALSGKVIYALQTSDSDLISSGSGPPQTLYQQFQTNGSLSGETSTCEEGAVHGFAYRLGTTNETTVRFAVGVVRDEAINLLGAAQSHYYQSQYPNISSAIDHFFEDYEDAAAEAQILDQAIQTTGTALAGTNYSDILALSTRQVFGAIDLTIPSDTLDTSDVKAFIKEISSDGNLNTVDIIFPLFPFFYVFAPEYIKLLLDPILEYSAAGRYPHPWTIHDLGTSYPNATGHDDGNDELMPIEETANMLILINAYERATGNTSWAKKYSSLLSGWATYLAQNGLYPVWQLSTTDGLGGFANMTNLAVKAAVGLSAYGNLTGQQKWASLGSSFAQTINTVDVGVFTSDSTDQPVFDLTYGDDTWYLTFNIYPSALLNLSTFNESTYTAQSDFYPTVRSEGGVAIDGNVQWGKTDWDFWAAAVASDDTRDMFVNDIHAYLANGLNTQPFSDRYWVAGDSEGLAVFRARPTVGAHWAVWAYQKGPNSGGL